MATTLLTCDDLVAAAAQSRSDWADEVVLVDLDACAGECLALFGRDVADCAEAEAAFDQPARQGTAAQGTEPSGVSDHIQFPRWSVSVVSSLLLSQILLVLPSIEP